MQRILSEMSVPSQRKVLLRAQELVRTPEFRDVPAPTPEEVRRFLADKPRFQAKFPVPEFPGRAQYSTRPLEILGADLIEKDKTTKAVKGNMRTGELQRFILVVGDRFTRKCWALTLPGKSTPEVIAGFGELWPEILKDAGASTTTRAGAKADTGPKQLVMDSATWATSAELAAWMKKRGVIVREKNSADRAQLQINSILDSAIKMIQEMLQNRRVQPDGTTDPAWVPHVAAAVAEYNRDAIQGLGMMNSKPYQAVKNKVVQFNMQQASGDALAESQKKVERVEQKLVGSTAARKADGSWSITKTDSEAFKEYVKDEEELAGRGSRTSGDDRWEGKGTPDQGGTDGHGGGPERQAAQHDQGSASSVYYPGHQDREDGEKHSGLPQGTQR